MRRLELQQCDRSVAIPDAVHRGKGCLGVIIGTASGAEADLDSIVAFSGCDGPAVLCSGRSDAVMTAQNEGI